MSRKCGTIAASLSTPYRINLQNPRGYWWELRGELWTFVGAERGISFPRAFDPKTRRRLSYWKPPAYPPTEKAVLFPINCPPSATMEVIEEAFEQLSLC